MAYIEMSFANHNILDIALSLIPPTVVQIRKNQGTEVNKYGQSEASYSEWIDVYGIVQPGGEQNEHTNGVDFSKKHVTIWLRGVALDGTHIQWAPDQIRYVGAIFNVVGVKDWFPYDNYRECDCVEAMNLGADQRSGLNKTSAATKPQDSVKPLVEHKAVDMPKTESAASKPPDKPSIFKPNDNGEVKVEKLAVEKNDAKTPIVGRAKIRF